MQVREYATISTASEAPPSLDVGVVSPATFDWLVDHASHLNGGDRVLYVNNRKELKLGSYVGYVQSPTGESIEILPKAELGVEDSGSARRTLQCMLSTALSLPARAYGPADLLRSDSPIHEWIFSQFLRNLKSLVIRGLRFNYEQIDEESRYIRGQLMVARQQRQPPGKAHLFHIRHDIFSANRIENRLLKTALNIVQAYCRSAENWRLANELSHQLEIIEPVSKPLQAMKSWHSSKLMETYNGIRPWCELILERLNPNFQQGLHKGIALLFPMEQLFEKYVEVCLKRNLPRGSHLRAQARTEYLLRHTPEGNNREANWFQLKPDLVLRSNAGQQVLDIKWKLLDQESASSESKYNIKQSDLYQLFAYGHKYQSGSGHLMLIYPSHRGFKSPLPPFHFNSQLTLWAVPFCIDEKCLVDGAWKEFFPGLLPQKSGLLSVG